MLATGVVQVVSHKKATFNTKFGPAYNFSFKMNEVWYQLPFCNPEQPEPLQQGQQLEFMYEVSQNGQYQNNTVNKKSLTVNGMPFADQPMPGGGHQQPPPNQQQGGYQQAPQQRVQPPQQQQQAQAPMRNSKKVPGIAVGMAINNAVALIAGGKVPVGGGTDLLLAIEGVAWDIIQLNDKMNKMVEQGFYPNEQKAPPPQQQIQGGQVPVPPEHPPQQQQASPQQALQQMGGYQQTSSQQAPGNPAGFDDFDDDIPF